MNYAPQGKQSKAWWIKAIKDVGMEGAVRTTLIEEYDVNGQQVKEALDHLVLGGYIVVEGKGGRDGYRYKLTSLGNRYLNENQDELLPHRFEVFEPPEKPAPKNTPVPKAPVYTGTPESKSTMGLNLTREKVSADATARAVADPPALSVKIEDTMAEPNENPTTDMRAYLDEVHQLRKKYGISDSSEAPVIKNIIERTTFEILFERYGDQITIKDILERL
jgi:hypothetical protein